MGPDGKNGPPVGGGGGKKNWGEIGTVKRRSESFKVKGLNYKRKELDSTKRQVRSAEKETSRGFRLKDREGIWTINSRIQNSG